MPIKAVESQRLYRRIAEQIVHLIRRGEYRPGQRLPPERDLARMLQVSRPSVREALIALEVEGYVEVRVGSGVYVMQQRQAAHAERLPPDSGPFELIAARAPAASCDSMEVITEVCSAIAAVQSSGVSKWCSSRVKSGPVRWSHSVRTASASALFALASAISR